MDTKMMEQFEVMDTEMLASKVGGKTIYYGNGLYCDNSKGCWVNWPEAINKILTNSIVNGFSGGNAGWNSGASIMRGLKWFSGGVERRRENIKCDSQLLPLKNILISYEYELKKGSISIPYTLSRMNIEISNVLIENALHLSEIQSDQIKKLRELSNIRYGY